jgi:hypothetical protein
MRVYESADGGRHWHSGLLPLPAPNHVCATSDPAVAVRFTGAQYYAFLGIRCVDGIPRGSSIYLAKRAGAGRPWRAPPMPVSTAGRTTTLIDDHPSITADDGARSPHRGRLYVGWTRFKFDPSSIWADPDAQEVDYLDVEALVSHSDDGGRHWSKPARLSQSGAPLEVRLSAAGDGTVYATWRESKTNGIYIAKSADGSSFSAGRLVAASVVRREHSCQTARARIPAQPRRCVSPNPTVSVDTSAGPRRGRVYVVWGSTSLNQSQDVYVAAFDPDLQPVLGVGRIQQVNPTEAIQGRDQFLPTSSIDEKSGRLWACYYETKAVGSALARFTCTGSDDGGRTWLQPVPAASWYSDESRRPANVANGYGDYEGAVVTRGRLVALWTDGGDLRKNQEEIYAAGIRTTNAVGPR